MSCIYKDITPTDERTKTRSVVCIATCKVCGEKVKGRKCDLLKTATCRHKSHGLYIQYSKIKSDSIMYVFQAMIKRCYKEYADSYRWYGAKGIKVCEEWRHHPERFEKWTFAQLKKMGLSKWERGCSIDRLDSSGDYSQDNCRITTLSENARNTSRTNWITIGNETLSGRQWAAKCGRSPCYFNIYAQNNGMDAAIEKIKEEYQAMSA